MDVNMRMSFFKHTQGLFTSLILSAMVALCMTTPIPSEHPRHLYTSLVRETRVLSDTHNEVYRNFKSIRHSDPDIRIDDFRIEGVPSIHDLPDPLARFSEMEESELLPIHYRRLQAFKMALAYAIQDEFELDMTGENNFHSNLSDVLYNLQRVVSKLQQTMVRLGISYDYDTMPTVVFSTNDSHSYLDMRILFVMQEFSETLRPALQDFAMFSHAHNHTSS